MKLNYGLLKIMRMVFVILPLLPTHCRCKGLLFHLTAHMDIYTPYTTLLEEGSAYPTIPASERPQAYVVYCAAAGIGCVEMYSNVVRSNITIFLYIKVAN